MDLEDASCRARYMIKDRDGKFPALGVSEELAAGFQPAAQDLVVVPVCPPGPVAFFVWASRTSWR
jgi:hypothetical protein